jgi:hypothetical protein
MLNKIIGNKKRGSIIIRPGSSKKSSTTSREIKRGGCGGCSRKRKINRG